MGVDRGRLDEHLLDAEVGELGLVDVVLVVESDGDLVDDLVATALADRRLHQLGLVPVDVVVGEDLADRADAGLDRGFVVGGGVLAEQVLQDVRRHDRVALDGLDQVLAHDDAGEVLVDLLVEGGLLRRLVGRLLGGDSFREVVVDHVQIGVFSHRSRLRSRSPSEGALERVHRLLVDAPLVRVGDALFEAELDRTVVVVVGVLAEQQLDALVTVPLLGRGLSRRSARAAGRWRSTSPRRTGQHAACAAGPCRSPARTGTASRRADRS